jgi:acylphosphatase
MDVRRHLWISGRVQGVWYRQSTADEAERLGVRGWVRNLSDGRVEAVAEGSAHAVAALERWCWSGPRGARVVTVEVREEPVEGLRGFRVRNDGG